MRTLLDTNACLRYLLCDNEDQATQVSELIEKGAEITLEVLAECVYVIKLIVRLLNQRFSNWKKHF